MRPLVQKQRFLLDLRKIIGGTGNWPKFRSDQLPRSSRHVSDPNNAAKETSRYVSDPNNAAKGTSRYVGDPNNGAKGTSRYVLDPNNAANETKF